MATIAGVTEVAVRGHVDRGLSLFYDAEFPKLVGALTLYCGDEEMAAELAQEAMARAWLNWTRVGSLESPAGWVYRVAINLANSAFRRAAVRIRVGHLHRHDEAAPASDVDTAVALRQAVSRLPRRQRTALVLRYFIDLSYDEVARLMGCQPATARTLASQAVASLRKSIDWVDAGGTDQ